MKLTVLTIGVAGRGDRRDQQPLLVHHHGELWEDAVMVHNQPYFRGTIASNM
jgi:hypothetical protein